MKSFVYLNTITNLNKCLHSSIINSHSVVYNKGFARVAVFTLLSERHNKAFSVLTG